MRIVIFFDPDSRYVLNALNDAVSHFVVATVDVSGQDFSFERFLPLKTIDYDCVVLAIKSNYALENVCQILRKLEIQKTVYIVNYTALLKNLPFMKNEVFLNNRVHALTWGGGRRKRMAQVI